MKLLQVLALLLLAAAITYAGYRYTGGMDPTGAPPKRYIINDIYSLVVVPNDDGSCKAAVGYREKSAIGTFVATPAKKLTCDEYYFRDRPDDVFENAPVVLVKLDNGEYHWILQSQLILELEE